MTMPSIRPTLSPLSLGDPASHSRSGRRLAPFRSASSPRTPTSSGWARPQMRQYASVNALQPSHPSYAASDHSTAPSSSHRALDDRPPDYANFVHLLLSVLSPRAEEWDVLGVKWWDSLEESEWDEAGVRQDEVVEWASEIRAMAKDDSTARPRIPAFLLEAARGQDPAMTKRVARDVTRAMLSVQTKAIEAHEAQDFLRSPPRKSHATRTYRSIGHRAARLYGTTKDEWEAEQNW
ncbi:hypothetical protein JCM8208_004531 [Rhodotorula glutinis]